MESGTMISGANRVEWLAMRRDLSRPYLGASDFSAALGLSDYCTPLQLYLYMTGQDERPREDWRMRRGHAMQQFVMGEYQLERQDPIVKEEVFYNGPMFHGVQLGATIDGISLKPRVVEGKSHGWRIKGKFGDEDEGADGIPASHYVQMLAQMDFAEIDHGTLVAAIDDHAPLFYDVEYSPDDAAKLLTDLEQFCWHVATRTPPPPIDPDDASLMWKAYKWANTEVVQIPAGIGAKVNELFILNLKKKPLDAQVREIEKAQKLLKAEISHFMAGHTIGHWGELEVEVKTHHREPVDACDYNTVRIYPIPTTKEKPKAPKKSKKPKGE